MKIIHIIGAGPAGLMAAQELAKKGFEVHVYDHNKAAARKFLVAGQGGFNLTHSMDYKLMLQAYSHPNMVKYLSDFTNQDTIKWLQDIGIETYKGSSGKIFPKKGIKPIEVLNTWLNYLKSLHVHIHYEHELISFDEKHLLVSNKEQQMMQIPYNKVILALGGASWPVTGSDGKWQNIFIDKNITLIPFQSANSGFNTTINYCELAGKPLKNIIVKFRNHEKKGEFIFTEYGIEGAPLYYLNQFIRPYNLPETIYIDLKPALSKVEIENILSIPYKQNITTILKTKLNIDFTAIILLKKLSKEQFNNPTLLSQFIKNYPLVIHSFRPIEEVISCSGGIDWAMLNHDLSLINFPKIYCIGEMLDWEAPTGGYLLQACFAMGHYIAKQIS